VSEPSAGRDRSRDLDAVLRRAEGFAQANGDARVTPTHLLLAVMSQFESPWPVRIVECGGLNFRSALRRLGWRRIAELQPETPAVCGYRSSVRLMLVVLFTRLPRSLTQLFRAGPEPSNHPLPGAASTPVLALAERFAAEQHRGGSEHSAPVDVGHLLLALASSPGGHLRLLDNSIVLACAVRRELGLATSSHRAVLACARLSLKARQVSMKIDAGVAANGRLSRSGAAWVAYAFGGLLIALIVFPVTVLANLVLYIFLWPAAILVTGLRSLGGLVVGCRTASHRLHEIPGGETALVGVDNRLSDRRVALVFLLPRLLAFALSVATMTVIVWRTERLGIPLFPTLFSRPDLVTSGSPETLVLVPIAILSDMLAENGTLGGIGLLAGVGLAFMSMPTYRELTLIRLYAGHEAGLGSQLARLLSAPATLLTGAIACIEAVLPFRNGPIYLTVYIVPAFFSLATAAAIVALLPY
jgi:hypothetical protein